MPARNATHGLMLDGPRQWELSPPQDNLGFVRGLMDALPAESTLYFEGIDFAPEVRDFFAAHPAAKPQRVMVNTLWPEPTWYHVSTSPETLQSLVALLETHPAAEVCLHFHAYDQQGMLMYWHDAFSDNKVLFSLRVPEESVRALAKLAESTYHEVGGA